MSSWMCAMWSMMRCDRHVLQDDDMTVHIPYARAIWSPERPNASEDASRDAERHYTVKELL